MRHLRLKVDTQRAQADPYGSRIRLHDAGALRRMHRRSIRFRLTVWYAVVLAAGLSLFSGLIWLSLRHRLMQEIDQDLEGRATRFERYFASESAEVAGDQLRDELEEFCQALPPSSYVDLRGANGFTFHYPVNARKEETKVRTVRRQFTFHQEAFRPGDLRSRYGGRTHPRPAASFALERRFRWSSRLPASGEHG